MKIDLMSGNAGPLPERCEADPGGQNAHVRDLSAALAARGHEVTVWTRRDRPDGASTLRTDAGVTLRLLDAGPQRPVPEDGLVPYLAALADGLRAAWAANPPAVVHAHGWTSGLASLAAARDRGVPVVQTFHTLGTGERRHGGVGDTSLPGRIRAERHLAGAVDRVVVGCSGDVVDVMRLGAPRDRIAVVPCGVDTATLTPDGPAHPRDGRPRLVSLSGLVRRQGVDEAVVALAGVPHAELVVAGGSGEGDRDIARLHAVATAHGVRDRVRFIGPVGRAEVPPLLRSADAVVCLPWYEPLGVVAVQAMACGRPVVASAVGGLADTVIDGVTGLLVPPRQPRMAAAVLRRTLGAPSTAQALGVAGRDRVESRYDWDRIAATIGDIYARTTEGVRRR